MSRFLFTVSPIPGHLNSFMSIAKAVQARGHSVGFYTGNRARSLLQEQGFEVFPFECFGDRTPFWEAWGAEEAHASIHTPVNLYRVFRDCIVGPIPDQVSDLERIIEAWRPDVLITDPILWAPFLVLWETRGLPVALLTYGLGYRMGGT